MTRESGDYHPRLVQILQEHRRGAGVLLAAHVLRSSRIVESYTNEILESLVVLASIETRRRVNILLEKGNRRSMRNLIGLNDIQIVVSLDLLVKRILTNRH